MSHDAVDIILTAVVGSVGWALRLAITRHLKLQDDIERRLDKLEREGVRQDHESRL